MRLLVETPTGWHREQSGRVVVFVAGELAHPTAVVEVSPIASVPDDNRAWVRITIASDIAPPAQLRIDRAEEIRGRDGWTAQLLVGAAIEHERTLDFRAGCFVRLLDDLGACIAVRALTAADLETAIAALLPNLVTATPDWSADGEVVSIRQLFAP